jgi:iron complex outermembrane receptor protein
MFADYKLPVAGLSLNGGVFHVGARPLDNQNTVDLPGYTRLDLGLRYLAQIGNRKATLRAQVENATDRRYWAAASYASVYAGKPRTVSLAMDVEM